MFPLSIHFYLTKGRQSEAVAGSCAVFTTKL